MYFLLSSWCVQVEKCSRQGKSYIWKNHSSQCVHTRDSKVAVKVNLKVKNENKNVVKFVGHTITNGL